MTNNASAMAVNRRDWLRMLSGAAGLATLGGVGSLALPRSAHAADYKALVCIYLVGGNDGFNMVVPTDATHYNQYAGARGLLALPKESLVRLTGSDYGLHPAMESLKGVWGQGHLAPVLNVGPLSAPINKAQYLAAGPNSDLVPDNLFSHSDQRRAWEGASTSALARTGWGARTTETLATVNPVISFGGNCRFGAGDRGIALALPKPGGSFSARGMRPGDLDKAANQIRKAAIDALYAPGQDGPLAESFASTQRGAFEMSERLQSLVAGRPGDHNVPNAIDKAFAGLIKGKELKTELAAQLYQVAKMIAGREQVQGDRHVFFASLEGFDTHADQVDSDDRTKGLHANLLRDLAEAMTAFHDAMQKLGLGQQVTAFTQSDFGRTYVPNNSQGSDHAWGNIHLVSGGAVLGRTTYGSYPTPVPGGPDDVGVQAWEMQGRWIPTASVDQYAATLLSWFGASDAQVDTILPGLAAFGKVRSLGFMAA